MTVGDASRVLVELRALGVQVEVVGDSLRFAPAPSVPAPLHARLVAEKAGVMALLHQESLATAGGDGDRPSVEKCRACGQRDFARPRAGGAWRCARCRPYDLPGTSVEWWPPIREAPGSLSAVRGTCDLPPMPQTCPCCRGVKPWRLKSGGPWVCSRCHPPLAECDAIETLEVAP